MMLRLTHNIMAGLRTGAFYPTLPKSHLVSGFYGTVAFKAQKKDTKHPGTTLTSSSVFSAHILLL